MSRRTHQPLPLQRLARKYAVQLLYQFDLGGMAPSEEVFDQYWEQAAEMHDLMGSREWRKTRPLAESMVRDILANRDELDEIIAAQARNWSVKRMAVVDRNILRMAVYELYYCPDIPAAVTINEAVGLAKGFASDDSSRFINGILDAISRTIVPRQSANPPDDLPS